jgi:hypothetical protein
MTPSKAGSRGSETGLLGLLARGYFPDGSKSVILFHAEVNTPPEHPSILPGPGKDLDGGTRSI